jgi:Domain of unknown function (DUF397)
MATQHMRAGDEHSSDEVPPSWKKCSLSYSTGGCIEVAGGTPDLVRVRDSKNPSGTILGFSSARWTTFVGEIQSGKFDRP